MTHKLLEYRSLSSPETNWRLKSTQIDLNRRKSVAHHSSRVDQNFNSVG